MWQKTEPFALPAELRAHIDCFSIKKVMKNGFLEYSILKEKSEKPDEKLEGKTGPVMEVHMDANAALSQLSYRPITTYQLTGDTQTIIRKLYYYTANRFICKDKSQKIPTSFPPPSLLRFSAGCFGSRSVPLWHTL